MVNFYFAKLEVTTFRGIRSLSLELSADAPTVIIGPNNAGKSTVLDAMGVCLSSPKFSKYIVDDRDFWTDELDNIADDFQIVLHFAARPGGSLPAVKAGLGDPIYVHGIRAVGNRGEPSTTRYLFDENGDNIMLNLGTPISKARKEEFKGQGLGGRRYARVMDISKWMPTIFQLDSHNLYSSLYEWQSGPLQKLMKLYREHLMSDAWEVAGPPKRQMPEFLDKMHRFLNDNVLPTPFWTETLAPELSQRFTEYLGRSSGFDLRPQLNDVEEWIKSDLMLRVSPGPDLAAVDSKRLGAGWQSLIRMAALEVLMKMESMSVLLLVEEPETFLHPHLRRRMRRSFTALQAKGSQCLLTTHSAEMISFSLNQDIVRLQMTKTGVVPSRYSTASATQAMKDEEKLHEHGNHEVVFAKAVVLTEGKSDECAVNLGLRKCAVDCDAESISVLGCGGVENLPDYAALCTTLGIPWVVVHDEDRDASGAQKPKTAKVAADLAGLAGAMGTVLTWNNSLEQVLDCPQAKADPRWILRSYDGSTWAQLQANPSIATFCQTIESVKATLGQ